MTEAETAAPAADVASPPSGSLIVVGTGIQLMGQVTLETESALRAATKVLYVVTDPVTKSWLGDLNETSEDLYSLYAEGKPRIQTYQEMVERILTYVRDGERVCAAFYGHPGVFVYPGFEAIRIARAEGYRATMLPGISAEDCLFADLGFDPGEMGCQSYEATDFLVYGRSFDKHVPLVLWQVSCIGQLTHETEIATRGLEVLAAQLADVYGGGHTAIIYEAARYPVCPPVINHVRIDQLPTADMSGISTLVVLPREKAVADLEAVRRLGIDQTYLMKKAGRVALVLDRESALGDPPRA